MKRILSQNLWSFAVLLLLLVIWQVAALVPRTAFFFGSPLLVGQALFNYGSVLLSETWVTGIEALSGFLIGIVLGTLTGFLLWYSPLVARIARPYIVVVGAVPIFAFAPIIILWFGIGIGMKIAMAAFGAFLVSLLQAYEGANTIDQEGQHLLRIFGASRFQALRIVVFPSALSLVLASMKMSVGFSLTGAFIGEFISANQGLGHFMLRAGSLYDIPAVFAGGIFLVLLAVMFNAAVAVAERNKMRIVEYCSVDRKLRRLLRS